MNGRAVVGLPAWVKRQSLARLRREILSCEAHEIAVRACRLARSSPSMAKIINTKKKDRREPHDT